MSKAFTKELDEIDDEEDPHATRPLLSGVKNYITPMGYQRLKDEMDHLWKVERPELVKTITWAASNGDRSENADYIYGKRRLREIDRRLRFLSNRLENAVVVDPVQRGTCDQIFFGATVTVRIENDAEYTYSIVGVDEADAGRGLVSWLSPLARALLKACIGDVVMLHTPDGEKQLMVLEVAYRRIIFDD